MSKLLNVAGILIGLSRPIELFLSNAPDFAAKSLLRELTFGLSEGSFDLNTGLRVYAPVGAAVGFRQITKYLIRHFPVR